MTVLLHGTWGCDGSPSCLLVSRSSMATDTGMLPSESNVLISPSGWPWTMPLSMSHA